MYSSPSISKVLNASLISSSVNIVPAISSTCLALPLLFFAGSILASR
jgi:hypothetical protein